MIYRLRFDRFNFLVGDISLAEVKAKLGHIFALDAARWADFWVPLDIQFSDDSELQNVTTPPDITCWFTNELILNHKAYQAIGKDLEPYGELLPANCEGIGYWILHVTSQTGMDAVDLEHSEREVAASGVIELQALAFDEEAIKDKLIFKTEYSDFQNIYCTEAFKALIENAGLKGLVFSSDLVSVTPDAG